jgi:hypothetical protein
MTEAEWLACTVPQKMLGFLRGKASDRKLRLFAVACCRRLWHCENNAGQNIVDLAERYADGFASRKELRRMSASLVARGGYSSAWALHNALQAVMRVNAQEAAQGASDFVGHYFYFHTIEGIRGTTVSDQQNAVAAKKVERELQTLILRDVVVNPFRPVTLNPSWLIWDDGTIPKLAQAIYDERAFDRLPILADALEEAGCHDADILQHCRQPGEHVRGCWVVDLILGKE